MSAFQQDANNFAGWFLAAGHYLALGTDANTPLTPGYRGYQHVPVVWSRAGGNDEGTAYLYASDGLLTNSKTFKWPEADDESGASQDGWGTLTHFFILDSQGNKRYVAEFPQSFTIHQDWRPRFEAGDLRIRFSITEASA